MFHLSNYRRLIAPEFNEHVINEPLKTGEEELRKQCFHMLFEDVDSFFSEGTHAFSVSCSSNIMYLLSSVTEFCSFDCAF